MKTIVLDWLANESPWASGVVVINRGHQLSSASVVFTSYETEASITSEVRIDPWKYGGLTVPPGNMSCVICGSDAVEVFATTRISYNSAFVVPSRLASLLGDVIQPVDSDRLNFWQPSLFWTLLKGADNAAIWSKALQQSAVRLAAIQIYTDFPDRVDRTLGIMDACPANGQALGHPVGAHATPPGTDLDVSYYTTQINNTQIGSSPTNIWDGDKLNSNFDLARNKAFFELIHSYLPEAVIMVDNRIAAALGNPSYLQGDSVPAYKHNLHAHLSLGSRINAQAGI